MVRCADGITAGFDMLDFVYISEDALIFSIDRIGATLLFQGTLTHHPLQIKSHCGTGSGITAWFRVISIFLHQ